MKRQGLKGFTLVELLMVVAIIAVIGAAVVGVYGRNTVDEAKRQMTLHEMGQIRDAFSRFYSDNLSQLNREGVFVPGTSEYLPTADFRSTFAVPEWAAATSASKFDRTYAMLEFFERYGLWGLVRDSVNIKNHQRDSEYFIVFDKPDFMTGNGWRGPYLQTQAMVTNAVDGVMFPQLETKFDGTYRILHFEHCEDEGVTGEPIYRRLLLVAAENPLEYDEWDELKEFSGNRRGGTDSTPLNLETGAIEPHLSSQGVFFMELLNLDTYVGSGN